MTRTRTTRRRTHRLAAVGALGVLAGAALLTGRALADASPDTSRYRTAVVTRTNVDETLQRSGTIEPVAQAAVAFPIGGTVAAVNVKAGDSVTTGQALATLDTTALQAVVTSRQASLADAKAALANALQGKPTAQAQTGSADGEASTSTAAESPTTASTATDPPAAAGPEDAGTSADGPADGTVSSLRQAVASGQQEVDRALGEAEAALAAATSACTSTSGADDSTAPEAASTTTSSTTTTTTTTTEDEGSPSGEGGGSTGSTQDRCMTALQDSLAAQRDVAEAESRLAEAQAALDRLLSSAAVPATPRVTTRVTTPARTVSAADVASAQSAVDAAAAQVTAAEQDVAQATIVSPIPGTVAAVGLAPGATVAAGSSTAVIVVVGPGAYEVTTTVPVADIGKVKVGDPATVVPDGTKKVLTGRTVFIGVAPATSGTTTVYPVVIGLTGTPSGLRNGASAAVAITVSSVKDVLAVPTSAVRTGEAGSLRFVMVLAGGETRAVPVQVGAIGAELTEVTAGLRQGQVVVLADASQPLPASGTGVGGDRFGGGGAEVGHAPGAGGG